MDVLNSPVNVFVQKSTSSVHSGRSRKTGNLKRGSTLVEVANIGKNHEKMLKTQTNFKMNNNYNNVPNSPASPNSQISNAVENILDN